MTSVALKRIQGLTTWIVVLLVIVGVFGVLSTLLSRLAIEEARDFVAGRIDEDEFVEANAPAALLGVVQIVAMIALVVLTMIWMYRLAANHRALHRVGTWSPGWAIGGWFLPPGGLYIIPYLMFRELWKASDPAVPAGDERWKQSPVGIIVTVWFVLYGLVLPITTLATQVGFGAGMFSADTETLAEAIDERYTVSLVLSVLTAIAAAVFIVMVRQLSSRHRQLTGESVQPT
jgi:Domain of unknown function (DUF4328)